MKRIGMTGWLIIIGLAAGSGVISALEQKPGKEVFAGRRQVLMEQMKEGIAVLKSPKRTARQSDLSSRFRQDSNIYYLTGIEEPDAIFLLIPEGKKKFIVFLRPRNVMRESWSGKTLGLEGALNLYGADEAHPIDKWEEMLHRYLRGKEKIFCDFKDDEWVQKLAGHASRFGRGKRNCLVDINYYLTEMRLIKGAEEVERIQRADDITAEAMIEAVKTARPGMYEYEIDAIISYVYRKNGCHRPGFNSIVASGPNAAVLHYQQNDRCMQAGDLLLMDIGAEYGHYSGDITRTIPVSGKFSRKQGEIYRLVLEAQKRGVESVKPGLGIREVMKVSTDILTDGLFRLGLITDKKSRWQVGLWIKYFQTSHWLGLDTHDVGSIGWEEEKGRILEPGMVFTIEPGIYIGEGTLEKLPEIFKGRVEDNELEAFVLKVKPVFEQYENISVRIEDDVLVTPEGYVNLSRRVPREIRDIEKLMRTGRASR